MQDDEMAKCQGCGDHLVVSVAEVRSGESDTCEPCIRGANFEAEAYEKAGY